MLEEDDGLRLQCLRRLTVYYEPFDNSQDISEADGYSRIASVLERARNLRALHVKGIETLLTSQNGHILGNAIALLNHLQEVVLFDIGEESTKLCERLTCHPEVVTLGGLRMENSMFPVLPFLQNTSTIILYGDIHTAYREAEVHLPLPPPTTLWPNTHDLRLNNMDPMQIVSLCPNLACLDVSFWSSYTHSAGVYASYNPRDEDYAYTSNTALIPPITARLRVLNVYTDSFTSFDLSRTVIMTVRLTYPVVLSMQVNFGNMAFWTQLAVLAKHPNSRLRYLDVLLDESSPLVQSWLDECLPLLADCGILCVHLKFVRYEHYVHWGEGSRASKPPIRGTSSYSFNKAWKNLRDVASTILVEAIPDLRYAFVTSGYTVFHRNGHENKPVVWQPEWGLYWRVVRHSLGKASDSESADGDEGLDGSRLVGISDEEGRRIDALMRSEDFARTLRF
ncbi:uncharacterized protein B0H18DRAFT_1036748 [Fomitopsis serialis]|uniref:uncharacterized protein n=1 Tax=Fomitopsis serialis TaxID=139415 RepID=UPI00200808F7|nr:uncharacterized protein B0H18DRAFT_1036748 [Neoantrodia serialis]KAH9916877.1 hypothetical protein B0H18DRAFT_1036748 [Neoantrodia serialis]